YIIFFSIRIRHTSSKRDWSSDVCSSDLERYESYLFLVSFHLLQYTFFEVFFFDSCKNSPNYSNKKSSSSSNISSSGSSTVEDESDNNHSSRATDSLLISIFHPVNLAAKRAFCPRLPIASDN